MKYALSMWLCPYPSAQSALPKANHTFWPMSNARRGVRNLQCRISIGRFLLAWVVIVLLSVLLNGCSTVVQRNPVPEQVVTQAQIPGFPKVRFWGDEVPIDVIEMIRKAFARQETAGLLYDANGNPKPATFLALSGGGSEGAFGAGLLKGWSAAGTRPEFIMVTGISTGALIAPFAFVGPEYDSQLKEFYTTTHTEDIFKLRWLLGALGRDSFSDTSPLKKLLEKHIDLQFLKRVAEEHAKGKTLLIGTTNLDAQRPVIWNMGAIASSNDSRAPELFRAIMMASAAIGGVFPPVYIPVDVDGESYDEMHVDGGTANQVFLYPAAMDVRASSEEVGFYRERSVYVVRNARIGPQWEEVEPRLTRIAVRSVATLIKTQGIGDLFRVYVGAKRDGIDYNLAYIPEDFAAEKETNFDPVYMRKMFDYAYSLAKEGYPWAKVPPGFAPPKLE